MARAPRASVSKTSGQGISRLSYQKGRALGGEIKGGNMGSGMGSGSSRLYSKKVDPIEVPPINVSYGDTYEPTDLADIKALGKRAPTGKAGASVKPGAPKKWPK